MKTMPKDPETQSKEEASCTAQEFWDKHVSRRKPKLFQKMPNTEEWNTAAWVKDFPEYLAKQAVSLTRIGMDEGCSFNGLR